MYIRYFYFDSFEMDTYIPTELTDRINQLVEEWKYDEAIAIANQILTRDPKNEQALLTITDIFYRKWDMDAADKAIDFLKSAKQDDPLILYIKWLIEMEKNNWKEARSHFKKAMQITDGKNYEIVRCYGLSEYWYGNREKWREYIKKAFRQNSLDAETIYNLIQLSTLDEDIEESIEMIEFYYNNHDKLQIVDKPLKWYDKQIALLEKFIKWKEKFNLIK